MLNENIKGYQNYNLADISFMSNALEMALVSLNKHTDTYGHPGHSIELLQVNWQIWFMYKLNKLDIEC